MSRRRQHHTLAAESLERRSMLAISVISASISGDVLSLVGDDLDSAVTFRVNAGDVVLTPGADTRINANAPGQAVTLSGVIRSLKADLKGGSDRIAADAAAPLALPGGATINLGSGNNVVQLSTPELPLQLGAVSITAAAGSDDVEIRGKAGSTIAGTLSMKLGDGDSTATFGGISLGSSSLTFTSGAGRDQLSMSGVTGGTVAVAAGLGEVEFIGTGIDVGAVTLSGERPIVQVDTSKLKGIKVAGQLDTRLLLSTIEVAGAVAASAVAPGGDVEMAISNFILYGDLVATTAGLGAIARVTLGAGGDGSAYATGNLFARAAGTDGGVILKTTSVVNFEGAKSISLLAPGLGGSVSAEFGDRFLAETAAFTATAAALAGRVNIISSVGIRASSIALVGWGGAALESRDGSVATGGDVRVASARGDASLLVRGLDVKGVSVIAGRDAAFSFDGAGDGIDDVRAALVVRGGRDASVVAGASDPAAKFSVLGSLSCTAGLDAVLRFPSVQTVFAVGGSCAVKGARAEVDIEANGQFGGDLAVTSTIGGFCSMSAAAATIFGRAVFTGGNGDDTLFAAPGVRFQNNLTVKYGAGDNEVEVVGSTDPSAGPQVAGALAITTAGGEDRIELINVTVAGATSISTGAGADEVRVTGVSRLLGNVSLTLGGGADLLSIGTFPGSTGPVTIQGALTADLGEENDILELGLSESAGGDASTLVVFVAAGSSIKGGSGVNVFSLITSRFTGLPLASITGFTSGAT